MPMDEDIFFMELERKREESKKQKLDQIETFYKEKECGYSEFYLQDRDLETINLFYGYLFGLKLLDDERVKVEFINIIKNNKYVILKDIVDKRIQKDKILESMKK